MAVLGGDDVHRAGQNDRPLGIARVDGAGEGRVLSRSRAVELVAELRHSGKAVVYLQRRFRRLHPGHVRYLETARSLGDALIVGVNADASVRRNKGLSRPVTPEGERAEVLAAFGVGRRGRDFPGGYPRRDRCRAFQPDTLVKGADWAGRSNRREGQYRKRRGGRVVLVPVEAGHSTTTIVERVRQASAKTAPLD